MSILFLSFFSQSFILGDSLLWRLLYTYFVLNSRSSLEPHPHYVDLPLVISLLAELAITLNVSLETLSDPFLRLALSTLAPMIWTILRSRYSHLIEDRRARPAVCSRAPMQVDIGREYRADRNTVAISIHSTG